MKNEYDVTFFGFFGFCFEKNLDFLTVNFSIRLTDSEQQSFLLAASMCARYGELSFLQAVSYCSTLAVVFVSSLYIFVPYEIQKLHRDDARQIRWRTMAASVVCIVATISHPFLFCDEKKQTPASASLSLRNACVATSYVLFHVAILYLQPIFKCFVVVYGFTARREDATSVMQLAQAFYAFHIEPTVSALWRPKDDSERWTLLRSLVVAPVTEEIVFRACMVPVLRSTGMLPWRVSFTAPLFFGFAHVHHAVLKLRQGRRLLPVLLETFFQFVYTSAFGAYVSYAFLKTGSLFAVILCHAFCNTMGLPDLSFLQRASPFYPRRQLFIAVYLFR